jgi:hypothetical protein
MLLPAFLRFASHDLAIDGAIPTEPIGGAVVDIGGRDRIAGCCCR